jgi:hypothetical protein
VPVSAALTASEGQPVPGMVVTFQRGDQIATAVTDDLGRASTTLHITGPAGNSLPLSVRFDGSGVYLPSAIEVPYRVAKKK